MTEKVPHLAHPASMQSRSDLAITLSVWKALFLREAMVRLFSKRAGTVWLLAEPAASVVLLMVIFSAIRARQFGGIDTGLWLMAGMIGFFMFRRTALFSMAAIHMNLPLFTYRQVKPIDAVLVRGTVEGVITFFVGLLLVVGGGLYGLDVIPGDPLSLLNGLFSLWALGMGFGLTTSVLAHLAQELRDVINIAMMPLYFLSGVIFPVDVIPQPYRDWVMLNPIVHAVDAMRVGFAPHYHIPDAADFIYPWQVALALIVVGLLLHRRFANRLLMR